MKHFQLSFIVALIAFTFSSCKDEPVVPAPNPKDEEVVLLSTLEKLAQTWILDETYQDDINQTKGGTGEYLYSEDGVFYFKSNDNWLAIGAYGFTGLDSTAINMTFSGASTAVLMDIKTLNESQLQTEFYSGGKKFNYNYIR